MPFARISEIIDELQAGRMIVLVDDEDRENEGDLCVAAEYATPEVINFMATHGRGLICLSMSESYIEKLDLPPQAEHNDSKYGTAFTISVDARHEITTGISAFDRAKTIQTCIDDDARPQDLVRPGHIFPLRAQKGGVLRRTGQTEGIVDLTRLSGLKSAGVICEIMKDDGTMARLPDLEKFIKTHDLKLCSIADIIEYRRHHEKLVERVVSVKMPTLHGEFDLHVYKSKVDEHLHLALCKGIPIRTGSQPRLKDPVLVRVHSECFTGDIFGSNLCDCGGQLHRAMDMIAEKGEGVLLYMKQEGRGIGLEAKLKAYHLQQTEGLDTIEANQALGFPADVRDYGIGAQILADLGIRKMELMTNNPKKYHALKGYGLEIVNRVSLEIPPTKENFRYLKCKKERMGHFLKNGDLANETGPSVESDTSDDCGSKASDGCGSKASDGCGCDEPGKPKSEASGDCGC